VDLLIEHQAHADLLDQADGSKRIPAVKSMLYRLHNKPLALEPFAGLPLQFMDERGLLVGQALLQHVGEELVVPIPATRVIQRIDKKVAVLQTFEHLLAVWPRRDRLAQ
jgi:hypothetical protein